ncbi:MAG: DUF748 domain-containing protein [Pseudomonadota bacterium]|nr:DUF748 domain-containing protein [Pseudomonadota bacterium]
MKKILSRVVASKITWAAAALLLLYTLGGFLLAPYLLERHLPRYAEEHLGQRASIGNVRINPYLFILDMSDFQLDGTSDSAMLKFKRLVVDFELSSIFRGGWAFAEIHTQGLDLRLEIDREGRLNVMDLVERLQGPKRPDQPSPSLIFEHVLVSDSSIHFSDLSGATPASTTFAPINLELTGFSTIPDRAGRYKLAATLPKGGTVAWEGNLTLDPLASSGEFSIKGMKLATAWQFLRDELRIAEPQGEVAFAGRYDFSQEQGKTTLGLTDIQAEISNLLVAPPAGSPALLALRSIRVDNARFALNDRELIVPRLSLSNGKLSASLASDGTLDWQRLVAITDAAPPADSGAATEDAADAAEAAAIEGSKKQSWRVRVENIGIEKVALAYTDYVSSPALVFQVGAVNSKFKLDAATGAEPSRVVVEDIQLTLDNAGVATAPGTVGAVQEAHGTPLATLDSFRLAGGRVDTQARTALVGNITMSNGGIAITRGPEGPTDLLQLLLPASSQSKEGSQPDSRALGAVPAVPAATVASAAPPDTSWKYRMGSLELEQFGIHLADLSFTPPIVFDINVVSAAVENIDSASKAPITFKTELRTGRQGIINGSGTLKQDFGQAHGKLDVTSFSLRPFRPVISYYTTLDLKSGRVAAFAELNYRAGASPEITAQGSTSVHNFRLNETGTEERLISWKTLSANRITLTLAPNRLAIKEVRLVEPGIKLVIDENRNVNLNDVLKSNPSGEVAVNQQSPAGKPPGKPADDHDGSPFVAEIGQIRLLGGSLDFADLSLILPFSTHVHALDGSIVGISSAPHSRADIELAGQVEAYGEASAVGALIPRDPRKFLDIKANFENIEMPPLSAYSATFAGRKIATGKLGLTLQYKIVDGNLAGENKIMLADFKLGERVEAPNALDLPLDLAIALLKGPDDRIDIAVPVAGDMNSPTFDYGVVIRSAIANLIRRVVSAPFRLLAGLLGGQEEELRKVEFEPGSDAIAPTQREQLDNLAQALKQRSQIGLVVQGPYDAQRDGQRLRSEYVHRDLAIAMGTRIEPGEDLGLIAYGDADTQKALEKLLAERAAAGAGDKVREFADEYAKRTGRPPDRVNVLLGLFGRGSEDRAFYEALFERLVELQPPPDSAVRLLAASRAQAIIDVLLKAGIDSKRLVSAGIKPVTGKPGTPVAAELSLDVAPGGP